MITSKFLTGQGLGNQLWVYAALRGISKKLDMPFRMDGMENFKGAGFLEIDPGRDESSPITQQNTFKEKMFFDPDLKYFASDYDDRVESLQSGTAIEGLFQSEAYFYEYASEVPNWIPLSDRMKDYAQQFQHVCVINLRGGEYKRHKNLILPEQYWLDAIKNVQEQKGIEDFLVVTDDRLYAKKMFPQFPVLEGGVAECYAALYGAKCLIVSNSSFSYFPVKTRLDKPYVIAPFQWSRFANEYNRWAAPANLYKDWVWQDKEGKLFSYEDCLVHQKATLEFYETQYNVLTTSEAIGPRTGLSKIPNSIKRPVKRVLSKIFPTHIG